MNESLRRDLQVFDFNEEDAINSDKLLNKFNKIPTNDSLAHDGQIKEVGVKNVPSNPCVDVDVIRGISDMETGCSNPSFKTMEDTFDSKVKNSELGADKQSNSISQESHCHFKINVDYYDGQKNRDTSGGASTTGTRHIGPSGSPSSKESVDVSSDADDCMNHESAPTSDASDIVENGVFHLSMNGCRLDGAHTSDMDDTNAEVVLRPDYIVYQDNYYMGPMLTFSHRCIKINVSTASMKQGAFDIEWGLDDLIDIKCQLFPSSGTVIIKINVISRNADQLDHVSDTSGIEELEIAVIDSNWALIHKQITSLNLKYLAIWNVMLNMDVEDTDTKSSGSRC
ncbi:hypothetical protein RYX36_021828 [Vicia faba]